MKPRWRERVRAWWCSKVGHREATDPNVVYCRRCSLVLRALSDNTEGR